MTPSRPGRPVPPRPPPAPRTAPVRPPEQPEQQGATGRATGAPSATKPAAGKPAGTKPSTSKPARRRKAAGKAEASKAATGKRAAADRAPADHAATERTPTDRSAADHAATDHAAADRTPAGSTVTTYTSGRRALGLPVRPAVISTGSADRFAERHAAYRRLVRRKVYLTSAGAASVVGLAWLLLLSPVLALDAAQVKVTGAGTVVAVDDVFAVVAAVAGVPLPRLDTVGLRDSVLGVPGVREAKVTREWPHGLAVSLVSREPVAAVPTPAPTAGPSAGLSPGFTLLDTEGYQVGTAVAAPEGLPVVSVPIDGKNERTLTAVLTVLQALPAPLRAEVATVAATSQDTVTMGLRDGATVDWGSASDATLKVAVLQALRAAPATAGAREFDVSAPTLPITR